MPEQAEKSVLQRMTGLRAQSARLSAMTATKALRNAIAKAGDEELDSVVVVSDVIEDVINPDDLGLGLPDPALFLRLDGPGDAIGLAVACPQVVGAVIEASTIGKILHSAAAERRPTRTDGMLVTSFIDPVMQGFAALAQGCATPPAVDGFHCGMAQGDARTAQMMLDSVPYRRFQIDLDFAGGGKKGKLFLIYPAERAVSLGKGIDTGGWHATLESAVMSTTARMEAVLCRAKLPIADIAALKVGDVVPLDGASLDGVSLVGTDGRQVINARLGRSGPMRAVRLFLDGKPPPRRAPMAEASPLSAMVDTGVAPAAPMPMDMGAMTMEPATMDMPAMAPMGMDPAAMDPGGMEPQPLDAFAEPLPEL